MACIQPVEYGRSCGTDMQETAWARRKARNNGVGLIVHFSAFTFSLNFQRQYDRDGIQCQFKKPICTWNHDNQNQKNNIGFINIFALYKPEIYFILIKKYFPEEEGKWRSR